MKLGVVYPQTELGGSPEAAKLIIQRVEAAGFDHLVTFDHPIATDLADRTPPIPSPFTPAHTFHDPFVLLTYAAALTSRLELCTGVLVLPERQTALVAKQATDLSLFSGGRLRLGVGSGQNRIEYAAMGRNFERRGAALDE